MNSKTVLALALALGSSAGASAQQADEVIVSRGGVSVTYADLDARMLEIPVDKREGFIDSPERIEQTLQQLLLVKQLAAEARAAKLDETPLAKARRQLLEDRVLADARAQHLREQQAQGDLDALARERYQAQREKWQKPTVTRVRHILVSGECPCNEDNRKQAEALLARARKGEDFSALAEANSKDTATKGGVLEIRPGQRLDPAFAKAVEALKQPGELSPVVRSRYGFHVIKLEGREAAGQQSFEEAREAIIAQLRDEALQRNLRDHTQGLLNQAIEAEPDTIAALRDRYDGGVIPLEQAGKR